MQQLDCGLIFVYLFPLITISVGLIMIFKKDWAWIYARRMLQHVRPQRTPEWERSTTINGVIILVFGLLWLVFIISQILD